MSKLTSLTSDSQPASSLATSSTHNSASALANTTASTHTATATTVATTSLTIAIAAGGTAGHINPALALAEELTARGHSVRFYGQSSRLEAELVPAAGFELVGLEVSGFIRSKPWTLATALRRLKKAESLLVQRFQSGELSKPDVAVGFGAYIELPLLRACRRLRIPYVLHEQNSVPGLANRMMASNASRLCLSVPAARQAFVKHNKHLDLGRVLLTGNPVRASVLSATCADGRAHFNIAPDKTVLLVFGGSLGADHINNCMSELKNDLLSRENLVVIHGTGQRGYTAAVEKLALTPEQAKRWLLFEYLSDMPLALAASDLVISRAGASSIAEIAARGLPSILVPFPEATEDHQTINAKYLVDAGAARLFADHALSSSDFAQTLFELLDKPELREQMHYAAKSLAQDKAALLLADAVEKAAIR